MEISNRQIASELVYIPGKNHISEMLHLPQKNDPAAAAILELTKRLAP